MDEYDKNIITNRDDIKDGTKAAYEYAMKRLMKLDPDKNPKWFMKHPKKTMRMLTTNDTTKKEQTLLATLCGFMAYMRYAGVPDKYPKMFQTWKKLYGPLAYVSNTRQGENEPTERQKNGMVSWDKLADMRTKLGKDAYGSKEHLLLSMYSMIPPRRQMDYHHVHILKKSVSDEEKKKMPAYIDTKQKPIHIVVNRYKTAKEGQYWTKELPKELLKVINASLKLKPRSVLFVDDRSGAPFTTVDSFQKNTNKTLKKLFDNKDVSVNSLRHAYTSWRQHQKFTVNELKESSDDMGHSLETSLKYVFIENND